MKPSVYLAGPITGLAYGDSTGWREHFSDRLAGYGIVGLSPLRHKDYLQHETVINDTYEGTLLSGQRQIWARDKYDSTHCNMLLANVLGAKRVSTGTMLEVGMAAACSIPILLVIEPEGNPHDHAMLREAAGWQAHNLDDAFKIVRAVLAVYAGPAVA